MHVLIAVLLVVVTAACGAKPTTPKQTAPTATLDQGRFETRHYWDFRTYLDRKTNRCFIRFSAGGGLETDVEVCKP